MTAATWATMIAVMAFVWGGFGLALITAVRGESGKVSVDSRDELGAAASDVAELPVMVYDWNDASIREIADNIWHAQMAGWPRVLTYEYRSAQVKRAIRRESLRQVPRIESRDEYPFASTSENDGSVWVGHASVSQQNEQRDLMNRFYREHKAYAKGTRLRFEVRVINHPKGDVTKATAPREDS